MTKNIGKIDKWIRIVLGIACVVSEVAVADSILDHVLNFIDSNTEGEIIEMERELR